MNARAFAKLPPKEKVRQRTEINPDTGCWLWTGVITAGGYGRIGGRQNVSYAHRFAWEAFRGPIPEGKHLDHKCRVRRCVNPDHLRAVTPRQNALENSNAPSAVHAAKQACPKCGGQYTRTPRGARFCMPCKLAWEKKRLADPVAGEKRRKYMREYYHAHPGLKAIKR